MIGRYYVTSWGKNS